MSEPLARLHAYPVRGPFYPPTPAHAFAGCPAGYRVAVHYGGAVGALIVTTEAEWTAAMRRDWARAATYYVAVGDPPPPEEAR